MANAENNKTKIEVYDAKTIEASVRQLRRWRDNPDEYPFVVGAVLPLLQAYEDLSRNHVG